MVLVELAAGAALLPELQAARTPPAPVASAPAPRPRSTERRAMACFRPAPAAAASEFMSPSFALGQRAGDGPPATSPLPGVPPTRPSSGSVITSEAGVIARFGYFVLFSFRLVAVADLTALPSSWRSRRRCAAAVGRDAHASIAAW